MSEASHPPVPLSPSGRRALAATMLGAATALPPFACSLLVDVLDGLSWSALATAGATPAEARTIMAALWVTDPGAGTVTAERAPQPGETCICGRPAVVVYVHDDGRETGYCGIPDGGRPRGGTRPGDDSRDGR